MLAFPKADVHRHLDGAVSNKDDRFFKAARRFGVKLPTDDPAEFAKLYQIVEPMSIDELLKRFGWAIALMRTPEGRSWAAYRQVCDLAEENILFAELRDAPGYQSIYPPPWYKPEDFEVEPFEPMSLDDAVKYALMGFEQGYKETGVEVNATLSIARECKKQYGLRSAYDIARLAMRWQDRGVVSLDLACDEFTYRPDVYAPVFESTIGSKIRRNPHAGEMGDDASCLRNIETCIYDLCADGLGHALPLWKAPGIIRQVKAGGIRVERDPFNLVASVDGAGEDVLLAEEVPLCIISDDPALMRKSLSQNFFALLNHYGWGEAEMQRLVANSVNYAFYRDEAQAKRVKEAFVARGLSRSLLM